MLANSRYNYIALAGIAFACHILQKESLHLRMSCDKLPIIYIYLSIYNIYTIHTKLMLGSTHCQSQHHSALAVDGTARLRLHSCLMGGWCKSQTTGSPILKLCSLVKYELTLRAWWARERQEVHLIADGRAGMPYEEKWPPGIGWGGGGGGGTLSMAMFSQAVYKLPGVRGLVLGD